MKWTFVQITHKGDSAGWQVPDILRDGNIRYFEDGLTAWQFADYQCSRYNRRHKTVKKVAVLNSALHFQKMADVQVGSKAATRLGFDSGEAKMPIHNIFVFQDSDDPNIPRFMAFGQIVKNGETQSVMNRYTLRSELVPSDMCWTNIQVLDMKRKFKFPVNTFFPESERKGDDFLAMPPKPVSKLSEALLNLGGVGSSLSASTLAENVWRQQRNDMLYTHRDSPFDGIIREGYVGGGSVSGRFNPQPLQQEEIQGRQARFQIIDDYNFNNDDPHRRTPNVDAPIDNQFQMEESPTEYLAWDAGWRNFYAPTPWSVQVDDEGRLIARRDLNTQEITGISSPAQPTPVPDVEPDGELIRTAAQFRGFISRFEQRFGRVPEYTVDYLTATEGWIPYSHNARSVWENERTNE